MNLACKNGVEPLDFIKRVLFYGQDVGARFDAYLMKQYEKFKDVYAVMNFTNGDAGIREMQDRLLDKMTKGDKLKIVYENGYPYTIIDKIIELSLGEKE